MNKKETFTNAPPRYSTAYKVDESKVLQSSVKPNPSNLQSKPSVSINKSIDNIKSNDPIVNNKVSDSKNDKKSDEFNPFMKLSRIPTDEELDYILNNDLPLEERKKHVKKKNPYIAKSMQDVDINKKDDNINSNCQYINSSSIHLGRKNRKNLDVIDAYDN